MSADIENASLTLLCDMQSGLRVALNFLAGRESNGLMDHFLVFLSVHINRAAKVTTLALHSPAGTTATVGLPLDRGPLTRVTLNGTIVWENGAPAHPMSGARFLRTEPTHLCFQIEPGDWQFSAEN